MSNTKFKYGLKELKCDFGPITFGNLIEAYRLAEEFSQKDFAKLCDLEKGLRIPSPGFNWPFKII
jgi:hypothetical protein